MRESVEEMKLGGEPEYEYLWTRAKALVFCFLFFLVDGKALQSSGHREPWPDIFLKNHFAAQRTDPREAREKPGERIMRTISQ